MITRVRNKSKGLKWYSLPEHFGVPDGQHITWLSHWKFKDEHLEGGDQVVVSVRMAHCFQVKELGIQFVHVEQESHNLMTLMSTIYPNDPCEIPSAEYLFNDEDIGDNEEEQQDDRSIAAPTGSNNCSSCLHGWKVLITAACNLTLSLSRRQKQQSESRG
ncbi:uncharacterized protein LOC110746197 [Prunus avium]|uniref:Uncharacterized protein LOC110746197 n=1 Tax=Prunus avium TaxID=42229 RepID=A0A6P5RJN8_PRUAV|nr:uncharacterized protein LOC110746197 [Prunus avium]XP_021802099.1 uncharacterized protein LOC110746197 [Prunus avium]